VCVYIVRSCIILSNTLADAYIMAIGREFLKLLLLPPLLEMGQISPSFYLVENSQVASNLLKITCSGYLRISEQPLII